jgi:hypothetical protein
MTQIYHNLGFQAQRHYFLRKLLKIAENSDNNIDHLLATFCLQTLDRCDWEGKRCQTVNGLLADYMNILASKFNFTWETYLQGPILKI